jgi:hypothetical protein
MAPKGEKKPAKKVAKTAKGGTGEKKKRTKAKQETFKIYIYKVLKQVSESISLVPHCLEAPPLLAVCLGSPGTPPDGPTAECIL